VPHWRSTARASPPDELPMLPVPAEPSPTRDELREQLHVWIARPEDFRDEAELSHYRSWLSDDERARADRYLDAADRHLFLVAHALLRSTLSRYSDCPPQGWRFATAEHGRPGMVNQVAGPGRVGFSLSHTRGMVACLVSEEIDCGVDVEGIGRVGDPRALAKRYFSQGECGDLDRLSDQDVDARFVEYWTLKEAYLKARGLGLELPLDRFSFVLGRGAPIAARFEPPIVDVAAAWQFDQWRPGREHVLAIAARRRGGGLRDVVQREVQPGTP